VKVGYGLLLMIEVIDKFGKQKVKLIAKALEK